MLVKLAYRGTGASARGVAFSWSVEIEVGRLQAGRGQRWISASE